MRTPALFDLMQKTGSISEHDMFNTFNMGVGMVLTVPAAEAGDTPETLHQRVEVEAEWQLLPKAVAMVCSGEIQ